MIEPVLIISGEGHIQQDLGKIEIRKIQRYVDSALCRFSAM